MRSIFRSWKITLALVVTHIVILGLAAHPSYALVKVSIVGDVNSSKIEGSLPASEPSAAKVGIGGGLLLELPFGLEIGALYHPRQLGTGSENLSARYLMVPVQMRAYPIPYFTLGLGGYYAQGIGNIQNEFASTKTSETFAQMEFKKSDFGLLGTVGFDLPMGALISLIIEGRYAYGLTGLGKSSSVYRDSKWRDVHGLVGFRFGL